MKQLLLIINPVAGTKKASKYLADIISVFNRAGYDTHVYVTAGKKDAVKAVRMYAGRIDLIVCCGGDGTLNETINGLIKLGLRTPIGYIPAGSTNDFANSLGLSGDVITAAKQIVNGTPHLYDIGKFEDRYFSYVASFGAFTKTSYTTPRTLKMPWGILHTCWMASRRFPRSRKSICVWKRTNLCWKMSIFSALSATLPA